MGNKGLEAQWPVEMANLQKNIAARATASENVQEKVVIQATIPPQEDLSSSLQIL